MQSVSTCVGLKSQTALLSSRTQGRGIRGVSRLEQFEAHVGYVDFIVSLRVRYYEFEDQIFLGRRDVFLRHGFRHCLESHGLPLLLTKRNVTVINVMEVVSLGSLQAVLSHVMSCLCSIV